MFVSGALNAPRAPAAGSASDWDAIGRDFVVAMRKNGG
jgi:hypothetical protein